MPYTYFRYIAYQVPTVAKTESGGLIYGIDPGRLGLPKLKGDVGNLGTDAPIRIRRLIKLMEKAQKVIRTSDNNNTLKIFMAPEFYFRPKNKLVSYTYEQFKAIRDVLQQTLSEDEKFYDWLVVPGTIMWYQDKTIKKREITDGESVYFNSTVYIQTGNSINKNSGLFTKKLKAKTSHRIEKTKASTVDGIPTGGHGGNYGLTKEEEGKRKSASVMFTKYAEGPKKNKHVFISGGIRFGLDICLDHQRNVTKDVIIENYDDKYVQLHLLTAGGQTIKDFSVAAIEDGYILRTDGYCPEKSIATNCRKVESYHKKEKWKIGKPIAFEECKLNEGGSEAKLSSEVEIGNTIKIIDGDPLYIANPEGGNEEHWKMRQQQISIYEICDIPNK